ncbi:MAG: PIN domain-containing protein [Sphingomonadales bacterium]|jgi:hypothetical protein
MLIGHYAAFLDANVLHPAFLRALMLWFADARLFRPQWSADVLAEWRRSVERRHPHVETAHWDKAQALFTSHFPDSEVSGYQALINGLQLPDADDRHVLAAAIVGGSNGIITANVRHFPADYVGSFGIEVVHPDDFIVHTIDLDEGQALAACKRHREAMQFSKPSIDRFLQHFEACGLKQSYQRLLRNRELI